MIMNIKTNIIPNIVFILAVIVVPVFFMAIASVGVDSEVLKILAG